MRPGPDDAAILDARFREAVAALDAGADPDATDTAWSTTPLGWAEYYLREGQRLEGRRRGDHEGIAAYLRTRGD